MSSIIQTDASQRKIARLRQPRTVIAHFFVPAHILPLAEVVRGPDTRQDVMDTGYTAAPPTIGMPRVIEAHYQRGELGVKTGRGFYDYAGQRYEDILRHRDRQLLKSVQLAEELLADPLDTKQN